MMVNFLPVTVMFTFCTHHESFRSVLDTGFKCIFVEEKKKKKHCNVVVLVNTQEEGFLGFFVCKIYMKKLEKIGLKKQLPQFDKH